MSRVASTTVEGEQMKSKYQKEIDRLARRDVKRLKKRPANKEAR